MLPRAKIELAEVAEDPGRIPFGDATGMVHGPGSGFCAMTSGSGTGSERVPAMVEGIRFGPTSEGVGSLI